MRRSEVIAILTAITTLALAAMSAAGFLGRTAWVFGLLASFRPQYAVPGINRVAYDVTSKPSGTIEWE